MKVVSLSASRTGRLYPQECSWYSYSLGSVGRKSKVKLIPRQAEVAQGVPGRLRPRIFSTFGTRRVAGRQPNAPATFTPGEIPGTHFQRLSRPQGTWFCRKEPWKKSPLSRPQGHGAIGRKYITEKSRDTTGNRSRDRPTSSAAP